MRPCNACSDQHYAKGFCSQKASQAVQHLYAVLLRAAALKEAPVMIAEKRKLFFSVFFKGFCSQKSCLALQEALEEENKARIEQAKKMDLLIKRMDHTERARRENEAPLLQEAYAQKVKVAFLCLVGFMLHAT